MEILWGEKDNFIILFYKMTTFYGFRGGDKQIR